MEAGRPYSYNNPGGRYDGLARLIMVEVVRSGCIPGLFRRQANNLLMGSVAIYKRKRTLG